MKHILLLAAIVVTISSCKKKDKTPAATAATTTTPTPTSTYYIQGNKNSTFVNANQMLSAQNDSMNNYYDGTTNPQYLSMSKFVNTPTSFEGWGIALYYNLDSMKIPTTYNNATDQIVIGYTSAAMVNYVNDGIDPNTKVTVTSKTGDLLQGTFSGKLYSSTDSVTVTNGKFKIKLYRK